ncbi:hypothetical protein PR202_ga23796 [Eleusine coracana subsp. coracana]|uniref:DUF569 domain-containing protein n=1 Tax=Eleusine coracana subsp. coracana TaxID=191504 RepID=A0AAV5D534_ELECO|nr:hypothetical protein QOZ80_1AG0006170 [Eleusine coracana subsp. coracana]GJN06104.1 hypothetical protein PR202_ga23796 [Eleusine coracana subsp. coracana]
MEEAAEFNGARFVRLRCRARRGKYLAADVDGRHVCLSGQRGVHNAVWAVEPAGVDGPPFVLLRGAYGRYLVASDLQAGTGPAHGVVAAQADLFCSPPPPGTLWQAVPRQGAFVVRSGTGRYLRANGRYLRWRRAVTAAGDNGSSMMQWDVEDVPIRMTRPCILDPICQMKHLRRSPPTESEVAREIRYARVVDADGSVSEQEWRTMQLHTHNLMQLRLTLACCMGVSRDVTRTTLCVRAGCYGQLTPLLIDLPIGNNPIDLVVVYHGTPADDELLYPDLNGSAEDNSCKDIIVQK